MSEESLPRLGEYLVTKKLVTPDALTAALAEQAITHEKLGLILVRSGFITRRALVDAILDMYPDRLFGEEAFTLKVPPETLIELKTLVVAETDDAVYLGTLGNEGQVRMELAPMFPGMQLIFVPFAHDRMEHYLQDMSMFLRNNENVMERIMREALASNVSDIHIVPRYHTYTIFFRYLGVRHHAHEGDLEEYKLLTARIKDLARMDLAERRIPQDGGFQVDHNGKLVDMRVATVPTPDGELIVIRLLDPDRIQPSLDLLGISRVADWRAGVSRPDGLCLICGPTGSGKTTTLNASVKEMDRFGRAVYTCEDPVEYRIPYAGQVNINPSVGLDFARAIRSFMRADPDVIVLGEVRDPETARNAIKAAETGHLVLATLHTGSIHGAVQRLRDLEVPQNELKYLLRSVLVQRLVRTTCKHCGGAGCVHCLNKGYSGRSVVSECAYFPGEREVDQMLSGEVWWPSMLDDAVGKVAQGETDRNEVVRVFGEEAARLLGD
jgi:type II secretory ATPase GspE/PulE/Tfp pilus assembly ATPase PilB-like protein